MGRHNHKQKHMAQDTSNSIEKARTVLAVHDSKTSARSFKSFKTDMCLYKEHSSGGLPFVGTKDILASIN